MSKRQMRRARERQVEREEKRGRRFTKRAGLASGAAIGATVVFAPAAQAATFTVDTLFDSDDGTCNATAADDCSLREAVDAANAAAGLDTVTFASGLSGTIRLNNGEIEISEEVTIAGPGADVVAVSGRNDSRIFYVDASTNGDAYDPVTISGLTLRNGYDSSGGGAIFSDSTSLTIADVVMRDNYGHVGGALYTDAGNVAITGSVFAGNEGTEGGALYIGDTEGTAADDVEVLIRDSVFTGNYAESSGGALYLGSPDGDVAIERSTFSDNEALTDGGAISAHSDAEIDITISASTISGNRAEEQGGGAYFADNDGDLLIENTTFSGNTAYYNGGGIYLGFLYEGETTTIRNSTIVDNVAGMDDDPTTDYAGGGVYLYDDSEDTTPPIVENGPVTISSTIVANNSADEGADLGQGEFADGFIVGHSLIEAPAEDTTGSPGAVTESPAGSNITGADPQLGPLAPNGGPTETHMPAETSPAVDAGVSNGLATDQRGAPRTVDLTNVANRQGSDGTDIGSVERAQIERSDCFGSTVVSKNGSEGNDTLLGTEQTDAIFGRGGNDRIDGVGARDCLFGEAGNDTLRGGAGSDLERGGAGKDKVRGQGGKDKLKGQAGKDRMNGGEGKDKIAGGAGGDRINGSAAKDKLKGNGGNDRINSVDNKRDKVNCGGGKGDKATVDALDKVKGNCETVREVDAKRGS